MNVDECSVGFDQGYFSGSMQLRNKNLRCFDRIRFLETSQPISCDEALTVRTFGKALRLPGNLCVDVKSLD